MWVAGGVTYGAQVNFGLKGSHRDAMKVDRWKVDVHGAPGGPVSLYRGTVR